VQDPGLPRRYAPRNDGDTVAVGNSIHRHYGTFRQNHIPLAASRRALAQFFLLPSVLTDGLNCDCEARSRKQEAIRGRGVVHPDCHA
jgi:hypothetical protein